MTAGLSVVISTRVRISGYGFLLAGAMLAGVARADESVDELSRQATDPTASLMSFGLIGGYTGNYYGNTPGDEYRTEIKFQPVIAGHYRTQLLGQPERVDRPVTICRRVLP